MANDSDSVRFTVGVEIPVGYGLASVEIQAAFGTAPFYTTMGVDLGDAGGDFVLAADSIKKSFTDSFGARLGNQFTVTGVNLLIGADGPSGSVRSSSGPVTGSRTSASDAVGMAAVVYKITNTLGRAGRGKSLLPGVLAESDVGAAGTIDTAPKASILTAYENWLTDLVTPALGFISTPPVLLHGETILMAPSPVVGATVRDKVGWVRGRLF